MEDSRLSENSLSRRGLPADLYQRTQLTGTVSRIVFHAQNSPFVIASLRLSGRGGMVTVKGSLDQVMPGMNVRLEGNWVSSRQYGAQFAVRSYSIEQTDSKDRMVRFFSSNFKGIGQAAAKRIVDALGEDPIREIHENPSVLIDRCHLSEKQADSIISQMSKSASAGPDAMRILALGLSKKAVDALSARHVAYDDLMADPYGLYFDLRDFTLGDAKKAAGAAGLSLNDPAALEALLDSQIRQACEHLGSTCLSIGQAAARTGMSQEQIEQAAAALKKRKRIVVENGMIYPRFLHFCENNIAKKIRLFSYPIQGAEQAQIDELIEEIETIESIRYDDSQKEAIRQFFSNSLMILNGGPGTGKSTTVRAILKIIQRLFPTAQTAVCAPTGRAAKRLFELTHVKASTIHSLLGWDMETGQFFKGSDDPLNCEFLIVDECSMIDTAVFSALLDALPSHVRILLIGDEEQLPSVQPGQVFNDLINANVLPISRLRMLHRQKQGSGIPVLCDEIRNGQKLTFTDSVEFKSAQKELSDVLFDQLQSMDHPDDLQVLAPKYAGSSGIHAINEKMQQLCNPFSPAKAQVIDSVTDSHGTRQVTFREGDKILVLKNFASLGIYNGDIGTIRQADPAAETVIVQVDKAEMEVPAADREKIISHGWCISIHKSQGSEYQQAAVIIDPAAESFLSRRLLYTAVSRAKKELTLIGDPVLFEAACRNKKADSRQTGLKERLMREFGR